MKKFIILLLVLFFLTQIIEKMKGAVHKEQTTSTDCLNQDYVVLIIRGHIRESFETPDLFNFIKDLSLKINLRIYIHTWSTFANNISWRDIKQNNNKVTQEIIYNYFGELKHLIDHIIIDDSDKIELIGNLKGTINNGPMPLIGWKNYWYGKYKIIKYIKERLNGNVVVNLRFDVLNNSNNFDKDFLIDFIIKNVNNKFTKNTFIFDYENNGIDNIYIGNVKTMYDLTHTFFYNLDDILAKNNDTVNQEKLVYRINQTI